MKKQKPKKSRPAPKPKAQPEELKGWAQIAQFLGQPIAVAQRWARSGMPVKREGRFMGFPRERRKFCACIGRAEASITLFLRQSDHELSRE